MERVSQCVGCAQPAPHQLSTTSFVDLLPLPTLSIEQRDTQTQPRAPDSCLHQTSVEGFTDAVTWSFVIFRNSRVRQGAFSQWRLIPDALASRACQPRSQCRHNRDGGPPLF